MAIAATNLAAAYNGTDATSYTTASVSPSGNALILVSIQTSGSPVSGDPAVTGNGITYTKVNDRTQGGQHQWLYRGMAASPSAGAITIDFGAETATSCAHSVNEFTGVDTSGTNGSGAIVQSAVNSAASGTSLTVTLAAFGDTTNNVAFGQHAHAANEATTLGTGFAQLSETTGNAPNSSFQVEWLTGQDTSVDASWTTSIANVGIAAEIKMAAAASGWGGLLSDQRNQLVQT